jgi:hypothetical protein
MSNDDWVTQLLKKADKDAAPSDASMMLRDGPEFVASYLNPSEGTPLEGGQFQSVRSLAAAQADPTCTLEDMALTAGTKVKFVATAEALFTYPDPPEPGSVGTVIEAKVAGVTATMHEGRAFVAWADGKARAIHQSHLTLAVQPSKTANKNRIRVGSSLDSLLGEFLKVADDTLVNRSSRDLWGLRQDSEGYVIERLFDDRGEPLKLA